MGDANVHLPAFLPKTVEFAPGLSYELLQPITTFRQCHDGSPAEGRIVLTCKRIQDGEVNSLEYIIKIKARVPERNSDSEATTEATSSNTTRAELKALSVFRNINNPYAPHLVDYKEAVQGPHGPLPGGYLTFTVMTKMPGDSLHNLYFWGMTDDERKEITERFLIALRSIYSLGIEPVDCALRNVLWEGETKTCTVIDFELWRAVEGPIQDETKEVQRWGLARTPAHKNHWEAWNAQWR